MTYDFVAGLWVGEGYFSSQCVNKNRKYLSFSTGIKMHIRDKKLLEMVQKFLGVGVMRIQRKTEKSEESVSYRIFKTNDVMFFSKVIGPRLVGYKKKQFIKWHKEFNNYKFYKA